MKSHLTLAICAVLALTAASQALGGTYNDAVLAEPSLLAYYTFDGDTAADGTAAADATGSNTGTYIGDAAVVSGLAGLGSAIDYDGSNVVNIGTVPGYGANLLTGASVEMWINTGDTAMEPILGRYTGNNEQQQYIRVNMDRFNFASKDDWLGIYNAYPLSTGAQSTNSGSNGALPGLTDGDWTYLCITMAYGEADGMDRLNIFVGKPGDENVTHYTYATTPQAKSYQYTYGPCEDFQGAGLYLGGISLTHGKYTGQMDEVALYSSALTYDQANAHFQAVPEPSALALILGLGLCLFATRRR